MSAAVGVVASDQLAHVDECLQAGELTAARLALREAAFTPDHYGWEFRYALLDADGEQAAARVRELLDNDPPTELRCRMAEFCAQYCLLSGKYDDGAALARRALRACAHDHDCRQLQLLAARLEYARGEDRAAEKILRRLLKESSDPGTNSQALWLLAESFAARRKFGVAEDLLSRFATRPENPYFAPAVTRLAELLDVTDETALAAQIRIRLIDDAPQFAALNDTVRTDDEPAVTIAFRVPANRAPRSLAQLFAVRVGEFDREADARRVHQRLLKQGYTVRMAELESGDRPRYVVDVGRFNSADAAARFKQRFERVTQQSFTVVAL